MAINDVVSLHQVAVAQKVVQQLLLLLLLMNLILSASLSNNMWLLITCRLMCKVLMLRWWHCIASRTACKLFCSARRTFASN